MVRVILGGESKINSKWVNQYLNEFAVRTLGIRYNHWEKGGELDFRLEVEKLKEKNAKYPFTQVIAKSVGTLVALYAIDEGIISPEICIFMGIPFGWGNNRQGLLGKSIQEELVELNLKYHKKIKYLQNENDEFCSAIKLQRVMPFLNIQVIPNKSDHWYKFEDTKDYLE